MSKEERQPESEPAAPNASYFARLWRGDVSLAVTFWVWGFLIFGVIRAIAQIAVRNPILPPKYVGWYYALTAASLAYSLFAWIAIWRSARKSTAKVGPRLAQIWVVLGVIGTVVMLAGLYLEITKSTFSDTDLSSMAYDANKLLPEKLDDVTVLESVSANKRTLSYRHTVTLNDRSLRLDYLRLHILSNICTNGGLVAMLNDGVVMVYDYHDSAGGHVGIFKATIEDCRQALTKP